MVAVSLETGEVGRRRRCGRRRTRRRTSQLYRAFSVDRRHRPHALGVRHRVRAGAAADPLHGDDPRGLLPRRHSRDPADDAKTEVERDYETNTGAGDRRGVPRHGRCRRPRCRPCWWPTTGRSPGARTPFKAIEHAEVLEYLARLEWRVRALNPDAAAPRRRFSSTSITSASTALGVLRTEVWLMARLDGHEICEARPCRIELNSQRRLVGSRRNARRFRGVSLAVVARHDARRKGWS